MSPSGPGVQMPPNAPGSQMGQMIMSSSGGQVGPGGPGSQIGQAASMGSGSPIGSGGSPTSHMALGSGPGSQMAESRVPMGPNEGRGSMGPTNPSGPMTNASPGIQIGSGGSTQIGPVIGPGLPTGPVTQINQTGSGGSVPVSSAGTGQENLNALQKAIDSMEEKGLQEDPRYSQLLALRARQGNMGEKQSFSSQQLQQLRYTITHHFYKFNFFTYVIERLYFSYSLRFFHILVCK